MNRLYILALAALVALGLNLIPLASAQEAEPTIEMGTPPEEVDPFGPPIPWTTGNPWTGVLQAQLRSLGFRPGPVDLHYGPQTVAAVQKFQRAVGIPDHGWWDWTSAMAAATYVPPAPPPQQVGSGCWAEEVAAAGLPAYFTTIIRRESNCQPGAINRSSGARGLTQVMPQHVTRWGTCPGISVNDLLDPQTNLWCAKRIFDRQGYRAWSTA